MFYSFSFCGKESTSFDLKIGYLGSSSDSNVSYYKVNTTSIRQRMGNRNLISSYVHEPLDFTNLSVINAGCHGYTAYDRYTLNKIMTWLTSSKHGEMVIHTSDRVDLKCTGMFYDISDCVYNGEVIGFNLKFKSESPYLRRNKYSTSFKNTSLITLTTPVFDFADLSGLGMKMRITFTDTVGGDLQIRNTTNDVQSSPIIIKGCKNGEVITIDSENEIISSSTRESLYKYFNYEYPILYRDLSKIDGDVENIFQFSKEVSVDVEYTPLRIGVGVFG